MDHQCRIAAQEIIQDIQLFGLQIISAVNTPVICVGAVKTMERAEEILSQGAADLVAVGRAMVADPEMVNKSLTGNNDDIVECVDCFGCFTTMSDDNGNGMECTQNPDLP